MKLLPLTLLIVVSLAWGCVPSDQAPPAAKTTPTTSAGDEISEMDFESGEVEESATELAEPVPEPTPEVP